jgi:small-conductance mechanosensitive channel
MKSNSIFLTVKKVLGYTLFEINQTPVSLFSILMFILVTLTFFLISRIVNRILLRRMLIRLKVQESTRFMLLRINHYLIIIIGIIVAFQFIGINLSGLAVIFGLLSVGIGFGLQNVTSNFVSGLILLLERPIQIGDRVTIGNTEGDVTEINMRSTTIRTLNNITYIVPNSDFISSNVINWSHGDPKIRLDIKVGVSYNSNLENVIAALKKVARKNPEVLNEPEPKVLLWEFGDSAWNMELQAWIKDPYQYRRIRSDINCAIVHQFREDQIEIAFPQQDIHLRSSIPFPLKATDKPD